MDRKHIAATAAFAALAGVGVGGGIEATVSDYRTRTIEVQVVPDVCSQALTAADQALTDGVTASTTAYQQARDICRVQAGDNR